MQLPQVPAVPWQLQVWSVSATYRDPLCPSSLVCPDPTAPQNPTSKEGKTWSKQNPLPSWAAPGHEQPGHGDTGRVAEGDRGKVAPVFSVPLIHATGMKRMRSRCESGNALGFVLELIPCREEPGHSHFSLEDTQGRLPRGSSDLCCESRGRS